MFPGEGDFCEVRHDGEEWYRKGANNQLTGDRGINTAEESSKCDLKLTLDSKE